MSDTATDKLPENPTQDQLRDAADEDGIAAFRAETDPALSPVKAHREAHAEGGEFGPKKATAKKATPAKKTAAKKATAKKTATTHTPSSGRNR